MAPTSSTSANNPGSTSASASTSVSISTKEVIVQHVGRLPASAQSLLRSTRSSDLTLVLSDAPFQLLGVEQGTSVRVNSRLATVYSTSHLMCGNPSPSFSSTDLALLSPCLYTAIDSAHPITVSALRRSPVQLQSVTLAVLHHAFQIAPDRATRAANLARSALLRRDAHPGDVIPVSPMLWLYIDSTQASSRFTKNDIQVVTKDTRIAVRLSLASSSQNMPFTKAAFRVSPALREWVCFKWAPYLSHVCNPTKNSLSIDSVSSSYSNAIRKISAALDNHAPLTVVLNPDTVQLNSLVTRAMLGRPVVHAVRATSSGIAAATARAELLVESMYNSTDVNLDKHDSVFVVISRNAQADDVAGTILKIVDKHSHQFTSNSSLVRNSQSLISLVICAPDLDSVHIDLRRAASLIVPLKIELPTESQRVDIFKNIEAPPSLASLCSGLSVDNIKNIGQVFQTCGLSSSERVALLATGPLPSVNAGGVSWKDIGGLGEVKRHVNSLMRRTRIRTSHPTQSRKVMSSSVNSGGVLLYGPPGTGKTLIARAVAGECGCAFIAVKGAELLDMYVGESERKVRSVFERAIDVSPSVVFFDEIDALAPARTRQGASDAGSAAVDRVVAQLLAELDESRKFPVIVIAATNRPDLVDPALTRPGRLDKLVYVGMPATREAQATVLKAQTRKFVLADDVHFISALNHAPHPPRLSGADLYALAACAWTTAAKRRISDERKHLAYDSCESSKKPSNISVGSDDVDILMTYVNGLHGRGVTYRRFLRSSTDEDGYTFLKIDENDQVEHLDSFVDVQQIDFVDAAKTLRPSLTVSQLKEYESLRHQIESGT